MPGGAIVVLFGAGASYGAGETVPRTPPLGRDLFDALRRLYIATWGQIPISLAVEFRANFEKGMGTVIEKHGFDVPPLMQDMAKFFSIFSVGDSSNLYVRLISHARDQGYLSSILLSTLNYECVLETAASRIGMSINYFGNLPNDSSSVGVWKLHGSCNFKLTGPEVTRQGSFSVSAGIEGGIQPLQPNEVQAYYSGNTALYPAMALFADGKPISIAPTLIKTVQAKWADVVMGASLVAIVGVNPNQKDQHIWTPIAETNARILYIGAEDVFEAWRTQYRSDKSSRFLGSRWDQCFEVFVAELADAG